MINMPTLIMSPGFDFAAKFYEMFSTDVSYYNLDGLLSGLRLAPRAGYPRQALERGETGQADLLSARR